MTTTVLLAPPNSPSGSSGGGYSNTLAGSWVQDEAGNVYWLETATDTEGNITYTYYDQPGGNIVSPTGDVSPVLDSNMQVIKRGDDVNGDGSLIVTFYRLNIYDEDGIILVSIPQNANGSVYAIQGVEIDPQDEIEVKLSEIESNTASIDANTAATATNTANTATNTASIDANTAATATSTASIDQRVAGSFINFDFDEVSLTYVSSGPATGEIQTATYSKSGSQVAVITLTYDATSGQLTNVLRA